MNEKFQLQIEKTSKLYTLIVVQKKNRILLGWKKRGFGAGKWNGFGGKVENSEAVTTCAKRELEEECGLKALSLRKHGILWFDCVADAEFIHEVHLFTVDDFVGQVKESDEMLPKWYTKDTIPFNKMWPSNRYWLPLALAGKNFDAYFLYKNEQEMIDFKILES